MRPIPHLSSTVAQRLSRPTPLLASCFSFNYLSAYHPIVVGTTPEASAAWMPRLSGLDHVGDPAPARPLAPVDPAIHRVVDL
jgi:hypothetical protein